MTGNMEYEIVMAKEEDREEILALYRAQLGRDYCPWSEEYPSNESIDWDFSRDALYVMKVRFEYRFLKCVQFMSVSWIRLPSGREQE